MSNHKPGIAQSRYRQLRISVTHETNGRFSVSLYAKRLNAQWSEQQCLARYTIPGTHLPLESTEDVLQALLCVIEETMIPQAVD